MTDNRDDGKGKVKSIEAKRRQKMEKIPKGFLVDAIGRHWAGDSRFLIAPTQKFHVFDPGDKGVIILEEYESGVVRRASKDHVQDAICRWIGQCMKDEPGLLTFTPTDHAACVRSFISHSEKLTEIPKAFAFADYDGLSFRRLDFIPTEANMWQDRHPWADEHLVSKFPILDLFRRSSQPEALAAWLGGLFYQDSYQQQYVYLHGPGGCGKSSLLKLLKHVIGDAYHADSLDNCSSRFWTMPFIGKRLVAFPDTNYSKFTATGTIKAITGGDDVRIEIKGGATFCVPLEARFIFVSNRAPELVDDEATRRRAIIVEAKGLDNHRTVAYEQRIMEPAQVQFFVEMVMEYYRTLCPSHEAIPVDQERLFEHAEDIDEDIGDFWASTTRLNDHGAISYEDLKMRLWERGIKSRADVRRHVQWACDQLPIVKTRVRTGTRNNRKVYFLGVSWDNCWNFAQQKNHIAESACGKLLPIISGGGTAK